MRKYAKTHEWLEDLGGGRVRLGVTAHAARELSDVVFVELPEPGREVGEGQSVCILESVKAVSDVYGPAGRVAEVNSRLKDDPGLVNRDPEGEGWIAVLEGVAEGTLERYLTKEQYEATLKGS